MNKNIVSVFIIVMFIAAIFMPMILSCNSAPLDAEPTLEEMIGQMIMIGFRGLEVNSSSDIVKDINKYHIGGIILFDYDVPSKSSPRNIVDPIQTKKLIHDLKELTTDDLFVAVDSEGGLVNRLKPKYGFAQINSAQKMGEGEPEDTYTQAMALGLELAYLEINTNFAPVVDVNVNQDNPVIGKIERSFSEDPQKVYEHAGYFIDAMHQYNIISALKHFPGHGSSTQDSHIGLVDITGTYQEQTELYPYQKLIEDGKADIIMTAHVMNRDIDPSNPATLSEKFLQQILRQRLGYEGVIISDDMQMGAIVENFGFETAIRKAINAGCDILIFSNNGSEYENDIAKKAFEAIMAAVEENEIDKENIVSSYGRIMKLKKDFGLTTEN